MGWERRYGRERVAELVAQSASAAEVLRELGLRAAGGNHASLRKWAAVWGIDTTHFDAHATQRRGGSRHRTPVRLEEVLVVRSTYGRGALKRRLYETGLKEHRCELCGQGEEWRGSRMSLILDHINGVADDNRLENLRIVCPNCNATLETHCGRNLPRHRRCAVCSESFVASYRSQQYCGKACAARRPQPTRGIPKPELRRAERPPEPQLLAEIDELGFSAVGRRYGVSDNAIRKWVRAYERERGADTPAD